MSVSPGTDEPLAGRPPHPMRPGHVYGLIAVYAALLFLPFLGSGRTLTRHEVIVALPALEMIEDGHWLVPHYAGRVWVDKPPLASWATALCFRLWGGFSEFAARLPAALSAVGLCVVVAAMGCRFLGAYAGVWAGLIQATSVYMFMQGRLGEIDMPLALILTGAHAVLLRRWGTGRTDLPLGSAAAFHALAGLGVLAKGPLAAALLGAGVLTFCLLRRSLRPLVAVVRTPAVLLFPLVGLSWYVLVWWKIGDLAWDRWWYSNVDRFAGRHVQGAQSPLVYVAAIPWMTLPWSLALVIRARRVWQDVRNPDHHVARYLWAWFLGGMVVLLVSAMKHKHYCIPMLPPLSILAAKLFAEDVPRYGAPVRRMAVGGFLAALGVFAAVSGWVMPARDHRAVRVGFVRRATRDLPESARLIVAGLAQSAVYPYLAHPWELCEGRPELEQALRDAEERPVYLLTLHPYLDQAPLREMDLEVVAAEPVRPKYPRPETLALVRIRPPPSGRPVSTSGPAAGPHPE